MRVSVNVCLCALVRVYVFVCECKMYNVCVCECKMYNVCVFRQGVSSVSLLAWQSLHVTSQPQDPNNMPTSVPWKLGLQFHSRTFFLLLLGTRADHPQHPA